MDHHHRIFTKRQRQKVNQLIDEVHKTNGDHSIAKYFPHYMDPETAVQLQAEVIQHHKDGLLKPEAWKSWGKSGFTKRTSVALGVKDLTYTYSGRTITAMDWLNSPVLKQVAKELGEKFSTTFNYALINRYADGEAGIPWHSDDEKDMAEGSIIASISLGAARDFQLRVKDKQKRRKKIMTVPLAHGSLIYMNQKLQSYYSHCVPVRKRIKKPRYNITFRKMKMNLKKK